MDNISFAWQLQNLSSMLDKNASRPSGSISTSYHDECFSVEIFVRGELTTTRRSFKIIMVSSVKSSWSWSVQRNVVSMYIWVINVIHDIFLVSQLSKTLTYLKWMMIRGTGYVLRLSSSVLSLIEVISTILSFPEDGITHPINNGGDEIWLYRVRLGDYAIWSLKYGPCHIRYKKSTHIIILWKTHHQVIILCHMILKQFEWNWLPDTSKLNRYELETCFFSSSIFDFLLTLSFFINENPISTSSRDAWNLKNPKNMDTSCVQYSVILFLGLRYCKIIDQRRIVSKSMSWPSER